MKLINARFLFLLLYFLILSDISGQGYLRTEGKKIVNDLGTVQLRGLNLGNWLVNEGYMMEMSPAADAPWEIREKIEEMIGKENTDRYYEIFRAHYVQERDIDTIYRLGFNHVRLPFHHDLISPARGVYTDDGFRYLDSTISWCKKRGMYVILDMHCVPGAANPEGHGDARNHKADLWNIPANQEWLYEIWQHIAKRYVDEPWVGGYDLINEPVNTADMPANKLLREVYVRATQAIREVDKKHILFIEGNWFASDFRGLTPPWDDNMVYNFHKYWVPPDVGHHQYMFDIMEKYNIPLWLSESGENSNHWYGDIIALMEDYQIGWCWWLYKKPNSITAPFRLNFTSGYFRLQDYWREAIEKPSMEYCTNVLFNFAKSTTLEFCEFNPDVYQALMRRDFKTTSSAYAENKVPGRIPAFHFDIGMNNVAYKDNVYETRSNSPFLTWNNNWVGRNDGVDLARSNVDCSIPYYVTGIEKGEWIKYTINAAEGGIYKLKLSIASAGSKGVMNVIVNGKKVKRKLKIPATMGKDKWVELDMGEILLNKGENNIKLFFIQGGFNIHHLELAR